MNITTRPTARSFIRFYVESLIPVLLLILMKLVEAKFHLISGVYFMYLLVLVFVVAWVLRSRFATASIGLFIIFLLVFSWYYLHTSGIRITEFESIIRNMHEVINTYLPRAVSRAAVLSSLLTLFYAEAFRRSITYVIEKGGVTIKGGIFRRQEVFYPYTQISNAVIEQGLLGRILGYGTVILVSTGGWGNEMYTRAVGGGGLVGRGIGVGVGYARTLQEVSRDPLKCLYGVANPVGIANTIKSKLAFTYEALEKQTELLEKIARNTAKTTTDKQTDAGNS